jgi:acyl-CoA dehydrogenase
MPADVQQLLRDIDVFIEAEIKPLQRENPELFDHRKEYTRTDIDRGGVPTKRWRDMLAEARRRFDAAGFYRYALPKQLGGREGSNLAMAMIREHLAGLGPGLHAELSHEQSVVGNLAQALLVHEFGTPEQKEQYQEALITGEIEMAFGLTEPNHGSDITWLETTARRDGNDWIINGAKRFNSLLDVAQIDLVFARTSGQPGKADGITAFLVPVTAPGFTIDFYHWTMVMPTEHAEVTLDDVRVPETAILGELGRGLDCAQLFLHENRIRQSASSLGAAQFCINESVKFAEQRIMFGKPLRDYQGIQWQLVELQTQAELVRNTVYKVAWMMDQMDRTEFPTITDRVSMCNYSANRLACEASDRAIQIHGGMGYTRHLPFESIYRHHRRYRLTEGSDEIQLRRIARGMFDFSSGAKSPVSS